MSDSFAHGYALLIGVGTCDYSAWSLPVTVKDVQALHGLLVDPNQCAYPAQPDHVRLLHDGGATRQSILAGLEWLACQAAVDPQATALLYFSGHGWLDQTSGRYYLIPADVAPFDVPGSALAADDFASAVGQITAARLLVCMDCCHAGGMATAKAPTLPPAFLARAMPKAVAAALRAGRGRAIFSACREDQQSWVLPDQSLSLFTHHLLEALQGAGNQPGERAVHLSNLMNYLGRMTPLTARQLCQVEQTPYFETAAEDFAVALIQGGRGLPPPAPPHPAPLPGPGSRNVVIAGNVQGAVIVTGDQNQVQT